MEEFDDYSDRYRAPMLVEGVIMKIEQASAEYLNPDGTIKAGCKGKVNDWEKENKVKLYWNSWFDVRHCELRSFVLT